MYLQNNVTVVRTIHYVYLDSQWFTKMTLLWEGGVFLYSAMDLEKGSCRYFQVKMVH